MTWKQRLKDDELYVLDLVQMPNGLRRMEPRPSNESRHEHTVLTSEPHSGHDLTMWRAYGQLTDNVCLADGARFKLEAHGSWITIEEFTYWRLPPDEKEKVPKSERPWVNGLPPLLPAK